VKRFVAALMLAGGLLVAGVTNANVTITAVESGIDVVFTYSGSIDLTGLDGPIPSGAGQRIAPTFLYNIDSATNSDYYTAAGANPPYTSVPSGYTTTTTFATSSSFSSVNSSLGMNSGYLFVSQGYTSNAPISSTMTFQNQSFTSMQLVAGTYVWTLTNGQTITLTIGSAPTPPTPQPIPTLSEWAQIVMMLAMIATAGFYGWRMKQR
jgi:hypothetical protein